MLIGQRIAAAGRMALHPAHGHPVRHACQPPLRQHPGQRRVVGQTFRLGATEPGNGILVIRKQGGLLAGKLALRLLHPPQPRQTRVVGSEANMGLLRRYQAARRRPEVMRALVDASKAMVPA